jgi:hypothetical protein
MGLHVKDQYEKGMVSNLLEESVASTFWAGRQKKFTAAKVSNLITFPNIPC